MDLQLFEDWVIWISFAILEICVYIFGKGIMMCLYILCFYRFLRNVDNIMKIPNKQENYDRVEHV